MPAAAAGDKLPVCVDALPPPHPVHRQRNCLVGKSFTKWTGHRSIGCLVNLAHVDLVRACTWLAWFQNEMTKINGKGEGMELSC